MHWYYCSKLQSEVLKDAISQIVGDAKEKNRKFTETVELQIGLKNYDPQKDKRFSDSVPHPSSKDEGVHAWWCPACWGGKQAVDDVLEILFIYMLSMLTVVH